VSWPATLAGVLSLLALLEIVMATLQEDPLWALCGIVFAVLSCAWAMLALRDR
jgi:hypothetical protein